MTYGFSCYAQNGDLLISTEYPSFHLLASTNIGQASAQALGAYSIYQVYYPFSHPPVVFIDMDIGDTAATWGFYRNGDYWIFNVSGSVRSSSGKIKCFGKIIAASSDNYGLIVKNSDGSINFSSNDSPLWITDYGDFASTVISAPNCDQITLTLQFANSNPIFLCNLIFRSYVPFQQALNLIGWKRVSENSFSSFAIYRDNLLSTTVRNQSIIVGELV